MLRVLEELCQLPNEREVLVVLGGDTIEQLNAPGARQMALTKAASMGLARPGLDTQSGPYPVDASGASSDDVVFGRVPVAGYRQDYKIRGGL